MAEKVDIISESLAQLNTDESKEYRDEYKAHQKEIRAYLEDVHATELKIEEEAVRYLEKKNDLSGFEEAIKQVIGEEKLKIITEAFLADTFEMTLVKQKDGFMQIDVIKDKKPYRTPFVLKDGESGIEASTLQSISLAIELYMLLVNIAGVQVFLTKPQMEKLEKEVNPIVENSDFKKALDTFKTEWTQNASDFGRATAVFNFYKATFPTGILKAFCKCIVSFMTSIDRIKALGSILLTIANAIRTGGRSLIARVRLCLKKLDPKLQKKITTMQELDDRERKIR